MSRPSLVVDISFLPSNSLTCCTPYSSIGSTMRTKSHPKSKPRHGILAVGSHSITQAITISGVVRESDRRAIRRVSLARACDHHGGNLEIDVSINGRVAWTSMVKSTGPVQSWVAVTVECQSSIIVDVQIVLGCILAVGSHSITQAITISGVVRESDQRAIRRVSLARACDSHGGNLGIDVSINGRVAGEIHVDIGVGRHLSFVGSGHGSIHHRDHTSNQQHASERLRNDDAMEEEQNGAKKHWSQTTGAPPRPPPLAPKPAAEA